MEQYKLISLFIVFIIYLIAMIPSIIVLSKSKKSNSKRFFTRKICLCIFLEIIVFLLIYIFSKDIVKYFSLLQNIKNFSSYALKIAFMASIITPIHYGVPFYFLKNKKKKKAILLFSLKIIYIPILFFMFNLFNIRIMLFTIPALDIIYSGILIYLMRISISENP